VQLPADAAHVVSSALWAAWGDALGFPAELGREAHDAQRRLGGASPAEPYSWSRRVGGRNGPTVTLPAGTYSDDTQLRLASGRCIRASGHFDAEAFSKIELPILLSYGLGVGRGTRAAAQYIARRSVRWNSNFFATRSSTYVNGGGNGAAMRIQPHVWAARSADPDALFPGVLRDAVTTHGHPRGILGAALHALTLAHVLHHHEAAPPATWGRLAGSLLDIAPLMAADDALAERWLPLWEREAGSSWTEAVDQVANEIRGMLDLAAQAALSQRPLEERYEELAARLGGLDPRSRGAGHISAVLAMWLAWVARDSPDRGVIAAATLQGSDTDTVASMAGGLLGPLTHQAPPGMLQDLPLLKSEALRLWRIGQRQPVEDFAHPDPLRWEPPATQSDVVGIVDDDFVVAGLGSATPMSDLLQGREDGVGWQWLRLDYGQTILAKRRVEPPTLPEQSLPRARPQRVAPPADTMTPQVRRLETGSVVNGQRLTEHIDDAVDQVIAHNFDLVLIGRLTIHFARMDHGSEKAAAFSELVANRLREHERD
jgi:ADP-ribosylglycohydrolase